MHRPHCQDLWNLHPPPVRFHRYTGHNLRVLQSLNTFEVHSRRLALPKKLLAGEQKRRSVPTSAQAA